MPPGTRKLLVGWHIGITMRFQMGDIILRVQERWAQKNARLWQALPGLSDTDTWAEPRKE